MCLGFCIFLNAWNEAYQKISEYHFIHEYLFDSSVKNVLFIWADKVFFTNGGRNISTLKYMTWCWHRILFLLLKFTIHFKYLLRKYGLKSDNEKGETIKY